MANKKNTSKHAKKEAETEKTKKYKINTEKENVKKKGKKKTNKKHPILRRIIKIMFILMIVLIIIGAGVFAGIYFGLFGDDFKIERDDLLISKNTSVVVDSEGNIIANLAGDENRKTIGINDMPEYLPEAFISIEDERFREHQGVDIKRTAAATVNYIANKLFKVGSSSFGGSTITQQLVKNLTNEKDDSPSRKIKEMSKAFQVERLISKDQILELYLNLIFLGDQAHGVEVASQYYFSKSAKDLTIAESAYLAGINHTPNSYKPFETYEGKENAEELKTKMKEKINNRTKTVLAKMNELGYINEEEYNAAKAEVDNGIAFKQGVISTGAASYSYHTEAAIKQVRDDLMEKNGWSKELAELNIRNNGYTIYSTQVSSVQAQMEEVFRDEKYIREKNGQKTQAGMVVIDNATGQVVGVMGGLGTEVNAAGLNRATDGKRQTGSSMKPLTSVMLGLKNNILTAATVYDDNATTFPGNYKPKNYNGFKGLITMRSAIATSQNIPQAKAMSEIGPDKAVDHLIEMGFKSIVTAEENPTHNDENIASMALGGLTIGASPLEMAAAYETIANDGEYIEPTFYTKVTDKDGNVVIEATQERKQIVNEQVAYVLKSLLTEPVVGSGGTATYCKISGMDVAAKTGSTNDYLDRWLCGFTEYYSAATWYGYDEPQSISYRGSPSNPAGALWIAVMKDIHTGLEGKRFEQPSGIVRATVCRETGLLAGEGCPSYSEIFVEGTVPTETCAGSTTLRICKQTGLIANEFCTDVEEKSFKTVPPKERDPKWTTTSSVNYENPPTEICTVHVKTADTTKPVLTLKGKETITIELGSKYEDPGATATDNEDGDITSKIVIDISKVDTTKTGTYTVTYTVSDSSGNTTTKTRKVKVVEKIETPEEPEEPSEGDEPDKDPEEPSEPET